MRGALRSIFDRLLVSLRVDIVATVVIGGRRSDANIAVSSINMQRVGANSQIITERASGGRERLRLPDD